jgi:UDP-2,3-diacylglucosamine hydrolase
LLVKFLDEIKNTAEKIYFVGDIFDFWWEYKSVVPKGNIRFLGKIAELSDSGIEIHFFTGNHDVWIKDYLKHELNIEIHTKEFTTEISGKKFFIAHGDGLGKGDFSYKLLKIAFTSKFLQWCFSRLHPNLAFFIATNWSHKRRKKEKYYEFKGLEKEILVQFAIENQKKQNFDYYIFGHRHFPMKIDISEHSSVINIGDWIINFTFIEFDGESCKLKTYKNSQIENFEQNLTAKYKVEIF